MIYQFLTICSNLDKMNIKNVTKKALKGEYQLLFELVNKCLFPRSEKRTTVTGPNLYLMDMLVKFKKICLPTLIIEHIHTVVTAKDGKYGLAYSSGLIKFLISLIWCMGNKKSIQLSRCSTWPLLRIMSVFLGEVMGSLSLLYPRWWKHKKS